MSLIGYARVSTADQNPSLQTDALIAAGCTRTFVETASGAQLDRPQLKAALDYIRPRETLVVWKLDRLARSLPQLITTIDLLHKRECGFQSLTEAIDTTTASGKLVFHIFASLTEFERSIIRERTKAGLNSAKARGKRGGRPRALNDQRLAAAKAILCASSMTIAEVASQIGISEATLYKYIPHPRSNTEIAMSKSLHQSEAVCGVPSSQPDLKVHEMLSFDLQHRLDRLHESRSTTAICPDLACAKCGSQRRSGHA
jgi:DNA invertase Pin-like site-specific DNA recombinase